MQVNTREAPIHPVVGPVNQDPDQEQQEHHQQQQKQEEEEESQELARRRGAQPKTKLRFIRPAQMSLFANLTSYPPLGQVTCVRRVQKALRSEEDDVVSLFFCFVVARTCRLGLFLWILFCWTATCIIHRPLEIVFCGSSRHMVFLVYKLTGNCLLANIISYASQSC